MKCENYWRREVMNTNDLLIVQYIYETTEKIKKKFLG